MQKRVDRDPIALGLLENFAPTILDGIIYLAKEIDQAAKNVVSNREDCYDLNRHVQDVVGYLQYINSVAPPNDIFIRSVNDLEDILNQCLEFIQEFGGAGKFRQIYSNKRYRRKFVELNKRLTDCKERLSWFMLGDVYVTLRHLQGQQIITTPSAIVDQRRRRHIGQRHYRQVNLM